MVKKEMMDIEDMIEILRHRSAGSGAGRRSYRHLHNKGEPAVLDKNSRPKFIGIFPGE